ncbi:MAG: C2 family cysteine protease [Planctomycetota bacterium]|nr:C2 family cysteine protease [Planctomycetota bacterium]
MQHQTRYGDDVGLCEPLETRCLFSAPARVVMPPRISDDYGNTFATASTLTMATDGSASTTGRIDYAGDVDVFTVTATQTGTLTVTMGATARRGVDSYLRIYDSTQTLLAENDDSGGTLDSFATVSVTAGAVYYVQASAYRRSVGTYAVKLSTAVTPTPTPTPSPASVTLPGADAYTAQQTVTAQLLTADAGVILVVLGTDASELLTLSESSGTISLAVTGGTTTTWSVPDSGTFVGLVVYGFGGNDTITLTYSLSSNLVEAVYAGAGGDSVYENSAAVAYVYGQDGADLLVAVGGGADHVYGGAGADSFWADSTDSLADVESAETAAKSVHRITSFTAATRSSSVSLEIAGQDMVDPTSSYTHSSAFTSQPLFADGVQYNDINQGNLGDCYFLAGLSALAQTDSALVNQSITALGDGTYAVRFYRNGVECYYRIDAQLPVTASGSLAYAGLTRNGSELWVALLEKAFAQFRSGQNSYASIEGGYLDEAYTALTGMSYTYCSTQGLSATALAQRMQAALAAGHAVTAGSTTTDNNPIVGNHAYEVHAVEYDSATGTWYVTVYNPWGVDGATWDSNASDGLLRLSASQFQSRFSSIETALA